MLHLLLYSGSTLHFGDIANMRHQWWGRLCFGIAFSMVLYGCLAGKAPAQVNAPVQPATGTGQPAAVQNNITYLPVIMGGSVAETPLASNSLYITSLDPTTLYNQGCTLGTRDLGLSGKQDSVVVLHFGYPRMVNNEYGARLYYPASPATDDQIAAAVEQFGYGYWYCVGADFDSHLRIGIGTSNYGGSIYSLVTSGHGQAWARMVNLVNDWFKNTCMRGCDGQVDAVGASDIELSWNDYTTSLDWLNGYDSANNYPLYNFGAIPGCPYLASPGAQCGGGGYYWSKEQVWMVTYGLNPVFPLPEIYRTDGVNAQQWYLMSVYSYTAHGAKMEFIGPMAQYQACLQRGGCSTIDNTADQAWKQLYTLLNGDARTAGETLPYATDILWLNEPFSAQANLQAPNAAQLSASSTDKLVQNLEQALKNNQLNSADRISLDEKLKLMQSASTKPAVRTAVPGQKSNSQAQLLAPTLSRAATPAPEEEILEGSEGLVHTWEASIQNLWEGQRTGIYYQVLAGASVEDPAQGLLLVIETSDTGQRIPHYYLTAEKVGRLRILSVKGTQLSLSSKNGGKLVFDLKTSAFTKP
jgi:hypothetical protein